MNTEGMIIGFFSPIMHRYLFSLMPPQVGGIAGRNCLNFSRPPSAQIDLPGTPPPLLLILILILIFVADRNRLISDISDGGNRRRFSEENDGHFASSRSYSRQCHPGISPKDFKMDPAGPNQLATIQQRRSSLLYYVLIIVSKRDHDTQP